MPVDPATRAYVTKRISQALVPVRDALVSLSTVQHRAASVVLPALAVGPNTVKAEWANPMPSNEYLAVACYAGNSSFPDLSGVVVAVMPDTQTLTSVDIRVTNTTLAQIGANRRVNVYAIHGGG